MTTPIVVRARCEPLSHAGTLGYYKEQGGHVPLSGHKLADGSRVLVPAYPLGVSRLRKELREAALTLAALVSLGAVPLTALGLNPQWQLTSRWVTMAASFLPYGLVAWGFVGLMVLLAGRGWWKLLVLPAVAGVVAHAWLAAPYWPSPAPEASGARLTIMSVNLYYGWGDGELPQKTAELRPDVVVVQEITYDALGRLDARGWAQQYPYRVGEPAEDWDAGGAMVFSTRPLTELEPGQESGVRQVLRLDVEGRPLTVVAVHTTNPVVGFDAWQSELDAVAAAALRQSGPLVVVGDFNATRDHVPMQQLLARTGLEDATEEAGVGWAPTFGTRYSPAVIAIDHVLTSGHLTTAAISTFGVPGSDHRGTVAQVAMDA